MPNLVENEGKPIDINAESNENLDDADRNGLTCWKQAYRRDYAECTEGNGKGVGSIVSDLIWSVLKTEEQAEMCFAQCKDDFTADGPVCWSPCPADTIECGALCLPSGLSCNAEF